VNPPEHRSRRALDEPHSTRLSPDDPLGDEILAAHRRAMDQDEAGYLDPGTGLLVLTAAFLADRGECCQSGCRHCPYLD
jgi:hypothetical protein